MKRIDLSIGNVSIAIESIEETLDLAVLGASRRFMTAAVQQPDVVINARWNAPMSPPRGRMLFDSGGVWTLHEDGSNLEYRLHSPTFGYEPYKIARMSRDLSVGEVALRRDAFADAKAIYPLEYPLDEILLSHRVARDGGVEIHGCGLVTPDGRGLLFVAQSGGGKTTTARLWIREAGAIVLSDDRIIVRRDGDSFRMWGTPWHGEERLAEPRSTPLDRILLLRQSNDNAIAPLRPAIALARLLACSFPPFHDRAAMDQTVATLDRIVRETPCFDLGFTPDRGAVACVLASN